MKLTANAGYVLTIRTTAAQIRRALLSMRIPCGPAIEPGDLADGEIPIAGTEVHIQVGQGYASVNASLPNGRISIGRECTSLDQILADLKAVGI